tara:strand:+ start:2383 stop:2595 length:213 start_codon:yes stop_codon:yes gene_type:complete
MMILLVVTLGVCSISGITVSLALMSMAIEALDDDDCSRAIKLDALHSASAITSLVLFFLFVLFATSLEIK